MSDDVIWHCIRHNHCSFMAKITTGIFCRNPYNATGICNRSSCPLANSRYATIRDHDGYPKGIEGTSLRRELKERLCGDDGMIYSYPFKVLDMEKGDVDPEEDEEEEVEEYVEGDYMDDMEDMEDFEGLPGGDYGNVTSASIDLI
ncbi:hypothetical protein DAI22_07g098501 [Oryza sativa Japonica Group]|nr:hypothetical protein DAI22_07g098501 [Oryza sativa Japonica Group]